MYGAEPFGSVPYGYVKDAGVPSALQQAIDANEGWVYLVEFDAKEIGASDETLFRFSTTGYVSPNVTGHPNDNVSFDNRVTSAFQLSRTIPIAPNTSRRIAENIGTIEIINTDGEFDTLLQTYAVDGRNVRVLFGLKTYAYRDFTVMFSGSIVSWKTDLKSLILTVRDKSYKLDRPLQNNLYGGTGGADGNVQIKNTPKPMCFQQVTNETPVFVDPPNLVWQIHDGAINSISAVRDSGSALSFVADYATYAALTGASLSIGQYATCLALGFIRLGGTPAGGVTFDAIGAIYSTSSPSSDTDVLFSILKTFGGVDDSDINISTWQRFTNNAAPSGKFFTNSPINVSDALDNYLGSVFAYWGCDLDGKYSCGALALADSNALGAKIDSSDIRDIEFMDPFDGTFPPRWRTQIGVNRNGTIQAPSELAAGVTAANVQIFGRPYTVFSSVDTSIKDDFASAVDPDILISPYIGNTGTSPGINPWEDMASNIQALLGAQNTPVRIDIGTKALKIQLGVSVQVTHPRIKDGLPWTCRFVGDDIDEANNKYDIYLWGDMS